VTRYVGAVLFDDSTRLYLIYDGLADAALRPLFLTEQAARDWLAAGAQITHMPDAAENSEEAVTLIADVTFEQAGFASRASKRAMWLTGPRSFLELFYENGATASSEL
jgi:hypothetical protein